MVSLARRIRNTDVVSDHKDGGMVSVRYDEGWNIT
jgi:hypothetical protein